MNKYTFKNNTDKKEYTRISKRAARAAYIAGKTVILCPCNLRPFGPWHPEIDINRDMHPDEITTDENAKNYFNKVVMRHEIYNCTDTETGKYTAFYIEM